MPDERTERIALNESRFRDINERLSADLAKLAPRPEVIPFVCECGMATCGATVELTTPEFESIRASSRRFFVVTGHDLPDVETVISASSSYSIVEKLPESGSLVDATDPRRGVH